MAELILIFGTGVDNNGAAVGNGGFDKSSVNRFVWRRDFGLAIEICERQGEKKQTAS